VHFYAEAEDMRADRLVAAELTEEPLPMTSPAQALTRHTTCAAAR
jgi:hypothetical protein